MGQSRKLLLRECTIEGEVVGAPARVSAARRPRRSVTVNLAESPLGWLYSRGHVDRRQFDAGEKLRLDWERGQMQPRVTMAWDGAPMRSGRGGRGAVPDLGAAQIDARRRFQAAIAAAGRAFRTSSGGSSVPARACAMLKRRWAGRRGPARWY